METQPWLALAENNTGSHLNQAFPTPAPAVDK
jgi:hypothetical protein